MGRGVFVARRSKMRNVLGILGGMGPLASAEFVKTIYQSNRPRYEQHSPLVVLISDPSFPDRTEAFLSGQEAELLARLTAGLDQLFEMGASRMIVCCITIHHLFPGLPPHLRDKTISLVDVVLSHIARRRTRHLLLCSNGTRKLEMFQRGPGWTEAADYVVLPDQADQYRFHELIYGIKLNDNIEEGLEFVKACLSKYEVHSFIAGCTETHLLVKHGLASGTLERSSCLDPLLILAEEAWKAQWYEQTEYQANV